LPPQFALNENWHYPGACIWLWWTLWWGKGAGLFFSSLTFSPQYIMGV
jgi:hypothetical protein